MTTNTPNTQERRDYGFAFGLITGTCVGVGLMVWLAPKATGEFKRMMVSAQSLGRRTAEQYQQASASVDSAIGELTRRGQDVRDEVVESVARGAHEVARGAHEVERFARSAASDRT